MRPPIQPHNLVLRVAAKMLIPPILMFALYVQFHGDTGPGGGFQAGVIFAAAIILYALVFGIGAGTGGRPRTAVAGTGMHSACCSTSASGWPRCLPAAISLTTTFWRRIVSRDSTWASF